MYIFQHITGQPVEQTMHVADNNILQNPPITREDVVTAEDIYGPSVQHFQGKPVHHKVQHVEPIIVQNVPKVILNMHKNVTLCCDLMNINGIVFLNNIYQNILFSTGSMIKNRKMKNIEDGNKQVNKLYLQRGFKITRIHADSIFEPLPSDMSDIGISLNCVSKKEHVPEI